MINNVKRRANNIKIKIMKFTVVVHCFAIWISDLIGTKAKRLSKIQQVANEHFEFAMSGCFMSGKKTALLKR